MRSVEFMPKDLENGVLYVSQKYRTAAHLCACGCGEKIRTPLGPTEWSVEMGAAGPTLYPSVGSWQRPCRSHYLNTNGAVRWANQWSDKQVEAGRRREAEVREEFFATRRMAARPSLWGWIRQLFGR
ncbi:MAG: DUF6527 family protein [Caulobacteraceae bacterium]